MVRIRIVEGDCTSQTEDLVETLKIDPEGRVPRSQEVSGFVRLPRDSVKLSCVAYKACG